MKLLIVAAFMAVVGFFGMSVFGEYEKHQVEQKAKLDEIWTPEYQADIVQRSMPNVSRARALCMGRSLTSWVGSAKEYKSLPPSEKEFVLRRAFESCR